MAVEVAVAVVMTMMMGVDLDVDVNEAKYVNVVIWLTSQQHPSPNVLMEVVVFHNVVGLTFIKEPGLANNKKYQSNIMNI